MADIKEIIKQEYVKCCTDPAHFMKKFCMIQHPVRGRILFNLYPFQEKVLHLFRDSENIIVLKSRQLGISTLGAGYALWLMLFHRDKNILCLATTQATARNLVTKVQFMYDNLPKWLQVPATQKNKLSLRLSNGSKIQAVSSNPDSARSEAVSLLLVDECISLDTKMLTQVTSGDTLKVEEQELTMEQLFSMGEPIEGQSWYEAVTDIRSLSGIKVMTPEGFKSVLKIKMSKTQGYYRVSLGNTKEIKASGSHKVLMQDGHFLYVNMLVRGMLLQGGIEVLSDPEWVEEETYLYDLLDVDGNVYVTANGITNHNCAFIDNIEETMAAAMPTLSTGGQVMLLSTPNGMGNYYHKTWVNAEMGLNSFVPVRLPWQVHPERDQKWRDQQEADMGKRQADQECVGPDTQVSIQDISDNTSNITIEELYKMLEVEQ